MWQVNGQFGRLFFLGLFESAWKPSESSVLSYYLSVFSSFCVFIFLSFHLSALVFSCPATFFLSSLFRGFYMDEWMEWLSGHRTSETLPKCKGNPFWKVAAQTGIAQKNWDPTPPSFFFGPFFPFWWTLWHKKREYKVCILPAMSICIKYTILRFVKGYCNSTTVACLFLTLPNWAKSANQFGKRSARDVKNVNRLELKMFRVLVCDFWIIGSTE